jgi:hypothetical protein
MALPVFGQLARSKTVVASLFDPPNTICLYQLANGSRNLLGQGYLGGSYSYPSTNGIIGGGANIYLDADLALKEQALAKTNPVKGVPKLFQPDDELLAFLKKV